MDPLLIVLGILALIVACVVGYCALTYSAHVDRMERLPPPYDDDRSSISRHRRIVDDIH